MKSSEKCEFSDKISWESEKSEMKHLNDKNSPSDTHEI